MSSSSGILNMTDFSKDDPSCKLPYIELIWNEIISYLSVKDQNELALVCQPLYCMVRQVQRKNSITFVGATDQDKNALKNEWLDDLKVFNKKLQCVQPRLLRNCSIYNSFEAFLVLMNNHDICQYLENLDVTLLEDWRCSRIWFPMFSKLKHLHLIGVSFPEDFVARILENCPQLYSFNCCIFRNPNEYANEGAYLVSLPKTIRKLCFLVYQPFLANLCSALENNGIKLEKLALKFYNNIRHELGYFDHDDVRSIIPWIYGSVTDLSLINCEGYLADFIKMKNLKRILITSGTIISNEEAKLFFSHCQTIEHVQIGEYKLPMKESYNSANYISLIKHLDLLPNLTSIRYICPYDCNILEIFADQASSLQVFSCIVNKGKMISGTLQGIHRMVNKLQKTLRVLTIECTDYDHSVFIELINSALDTPRTFTVYLPADAAEGYSKEIVGRITVIHASHIPHDLNIPPPEES